MKSSQPEGTEMLLCQTCEPYLESAGYRLIPADPIKPTAGECSICHERTTVRAYLVDRLKRR